MDAGHHHHLHHHRQQQQQHQILQQQQISSSSSLQDTTSGGDRFPQWSLQETRDFVMIRAELDPTFMETKRNKVLWQVIAAKMKERGYHRSAEQCKCKWKNLVTRYKGCETMEPEGMKQQFPFYNELQTIFAARMQRMLWNEAEGSGGGGSNKKKSAQVSSSDDDEGDRDENEESDGDHKGSMSGVKKKRKTSKQAGNANVGDHVMINKNVKEMLEDFMKQQMQMEMQWMKAYEAREDERRVREMEWRQKMEALENERIAMESRWREREEETRAREEARAEKRDALINALLNKLTREDNKS